MIIINFVGRGIGRIRVVDILLAVRLAVCCWSFQKIRSNWLLMAKRERKRYETLAGEEGGGHCDLHQDDLSFKSSPSPPFTI